VLPVRRKRLFAALLVALASAGVLAFLWASIGASGPVAPLRTLADVPLVGGTGRLDYASLDNSAGVLYIAHLGADSVIAVDIKQNRVITTISNTPSVRGVLVVPELERVYAAAEGSREVVVIDERSNKVLARVRAGDVDGLAFDPRTHRLFVSDENGNADAVIDTRTNRLVAKIALGGEAGNTQYDEVSRHIFVAVQTRNDVVEIDPRSLTIVRRYPLPGCLRGHGLAIDSSHRYAYVACQLNSALVRLNLVTGLVDATSSVGIGADVLAIDYGLERLYVASESGILTVFETKNRAFEKIGQSIFAANAHVVAVDQRSHRVYFPIANSAGRPLLRISLPTRPGGRP
jgi:DNA-binding beta-propeller fold protein YncE